MKTSSSLSSYKKYNDKKSKEIIELENELINKKSWDMLGEVKSGQRPENSLLSLSSIIERASKPIPIVSQDYTNTIEDIIINRIKNDNFNDIIYKKKSTSINDNNNDNDDDINEKSKIGLGQIYENEYIATNNTTSKSNSNKNDDANKQEIKELFNIINKQLDALSHFHYTPKPVVNDINITSIKNTTTSNMRSILIENINPTNESDANALAPDEVYKKKTGRDASLKSNVEYDRDDKKRLRSASKSKKRKEKKQKTIDDTIKAKANIYSKEARKLDDKLVDDIIKQDKRVTIGKNSTDDTSSFSNSKSFFTKVQNLKEK
jgi:U3 small nucleolar RNA-associated protein MPP10